MPSNKKILIVQKLKEKLKKAQGLVLADYTGLRVEQINQLRKEIKEVGGEFEVVKNTLFQLAVHQEKGSLPRDFNEVEALRGPTVVLWLYQEDPQPIKILDRFIEENDRPQIKGGFWQGEKLSLAKIKALARLPGIKELRGQLIASLQRPTLGLIQSLNGNLRKLVLVLNAKIKNQNEK